MTEDAFAALFPRFDEASRLRFKALIFDLAASKHAPKIAAQVIYERLNLIQAPDGFSLRGSPTTAQIRKQFGRSGYKVADNFFARLLVSEPKSEPKIFEGYLAWIAAAALWYRMPSPEQANNFDGEVSAIETACNALRLLFERGEVADIERLPDPTREPVKLIGALEVAQDMIGQTSLIGTRYASLRVAITYLVNRSRPVKRERDELQIGVYEPLGGHEGEKDDDRISLLSEYHRTRASSLNSAYFRYDAGPRNDVIELKPRRRYPRAAGQQIIAARHAAKHIAIRRLGLVCDHHSLTTHEARTLGTELSSKIFDQRVSIDNKRSAVFALLSLLTGRTVDRLALIPHLEGRNEQVFERWIIDKNGLALGFHLDLPRNELGRAGAKWCDKLRRDELILELPPALAPPLQAYLALLNVDRPDLFGTPLDQHATQVRREVSQLLKSITAGWPRRIHPGHLPTALEAQLKASGEDAALIGLLTGRQPKQLPALYYARMSTDNAANVWRSAVKAAFNLKMPPPAFHQTEAIGSRVQPRHDHFKKYFAVMRARFEEADKSRRRSNVENVHDAYTLLVFQIMALGTGYRETTEALGTIHEVDMRTRTMLISDKENRAGNAARLIMLGDIAGRQLELYVEHLQWLSDNRMLFPAIGGRAAQSIDGTKALFFFQTGTTDEALKPGELDKRLRPLMQLPTNWPRHTLRTWLSERLDTSLINAFMGHSDIGDEYLASEAGIAISELRRVADEIDRLMQSLGITPIRGFTHG